MSCGMGMIKYLLFIFNFIFALGGLAILVVGVIVHLEVNNYTDAVDISVTFPSIVLIVIGSIIFLIAFFGCCGAIRESHCMIVTFASCLLTILIIQVAIAVYVFVVFKDTNIDVRTTYGQVFDKYYKDSASRQVVDSIQSSLHCCGVDKYTDFTRRLSNITIPWSCCPDHAEGTTCSLTDNIYDRGCASVLKEAINKAGSIVGGIALGIGGIELVGIIFALCLANSVRHAERRGYRV